MPTNDGTAEGKETACKLNFEGKWITHNNLKVQVLGELGGHWFGIVTIDKFDIPTYWDEKGESLNPFLNLKSKVRDGQKYKGGN